MFGYIHSYQSKPDSKITGARRVYEACRKGLKGREDIDWIDATQKYYSFNPLDTKKYFLEDANYLDNTFKSLNSIAALVLDVIPLYDRAFDSTYFWWKPKFDAIKHYDRVIVPSEWVKKTLIEDLGVQNEKIQVVKLGVDRKIFRPKKINREIFCRIYNIDPEKRLLGHVSFGYPRKNLERLFTVGSSDPEAQILKVGDDPFTPGVIQKIGVQGQVKILPAMNDLELSEFYNVIDAFVFPSTSEGFGLPALEAQACGCPTILSNTTALAEIIGPRGLGVDPFSVDEIRAAIEKVGERGENFTGWNYGEEEWLNQFDWKNIGHAVNDWLT